MEVTIIGLGFVGLTTSLGFSEKGIKVYGYDINPKKLELLKKFVIPFHEPQLLDKLKSYSNNKFEIVDSLDKCINKSDAVFICVGTPCNKNGSVNISSIINSIKQIIKNRKKKSNFFTIVIKSSVPPSTSKEKIKPILTSYGIKVGEEIGLSNNPEFLREGSAWEDFINPDRIIIGTEDDKSRNILEEIYKPFDAPIINVNLNTAEFIKYLSNTLLATMISYSNEMSILADHIGDIDIKIAFKSLHMDRRWFGYPAGISTYVYPGAGFGGYCLPKDTCALFAMAKEKGYNSKILKSTLQINYKIKNHLIEKIKNSVSFDKSIGILGLSFKPGSDDVRESPAKDFINLLIESGFNKKKIFAYDPLAIENFKNTYDIDINYINSLENIVKLTDILIILTGWKEFINKYKLFKNKSIFDFRYIL